MSSSEDSDCLTTHPRYEDVITNDSLSRGDCIGICGNAQTAARRRDIWWSIWLNVIRQTSKLRDCRFLSCRRRCNLWYSQSFVSVESCITKCQGACSTVLCQLLHATQGSFKPHTTYVTILGIAVMVMLTARLEAVMMLVPVIEATVRLTRSVDVS